MIRPIIIFTTFWEANKIISVMPYSSQFKVHSIALSNPPMDKLDKIKEITRLDFFCPNWEILRKYKEDHNWEAYTESFMQLMKGRNKEVIDWFKTLEPNHRYFLCCWENTQKGANCHRQLIYSALKKNEALRSKYHLVYRHGNK